MTCLCSTVGLVFTTSSSPISRAIRFFTGSEVSHVAVGVQLFGERVLLHAALDGDVSGVQVTTRERWLEKNELVAEYEVIPDVSANVGRMVAMIGEKYDVLGLIGYVLVIAATWLGKWIENPLANPKAWVCPRYVLKLDPTSVVVSEWSTLDSERVTPQDLLSVCQSGSSFRRVIDQTHRC